MIIRKRTLSAILTVALAASLFVCAPTGAYGSDNSQFIIHNFSPHIIPHKKVETAAE